MAHLYRPRIVFQSNLELLIDNAITMASKLASLWDSSDYADKQTLQKLVFPEGLSYCRKTNECRTLRINSVFHFIADVTGISAKNKSGNITLSSDVPAFVDSPDELSNRLMFFFRQIFALKAVLVNYQ